MPYALVKAPARHSRYARDSRFAIAAADPALRDADVSSASANVIAVRFSETEGRADEAIITVAGDLDLANVLEFRDVAFSALGRKPALLRLDLTQVSFLDTAGLSALLTVARVTRLLGFQARVTSSPRVRRTLALSGLADALEA